MDAGDIALHDEEKSAQKVCRYRTLHDKVSLMVC